MKGRREKSHAGWIDQATLFYSNLLVDKELRAKMASLGVSADQLERALSEIRRVAEVRDRRQEQAGRAQQATRERNAALDALGDWMRQNKALARVLMDDQPQQLEKLGLLARSG